MPSIQRVSNLYKSMSQFENPQDSGLLHRYDRLQQLGDKTQQKDKKQEFKKILERKMQKR